VRADAGQATLEAALAMPVVLLALLLIVQVGIVVRDALALDQAAREGARAMAITASPDEARAAVGRAAGPLDASRVATSVSDATKRGEDADVDLSYIEELRIPIVSKIVSLHLPLKAEATMRLERDAPP
jgi:Flp pilus assembly protein TadG